MAPPPGLSPGKSQGRRSLVGCSPRGREESDTTARLHFHFSVSCTGEGHGNPLQCSRLGNPRDGVAQSRTRLKGLSSSSRTGAVSQDNSASTPCGDPNSTAATHSFNQAPSFPRTGVRSCHRITYPKCTAEGLPQGSGISALGSPGAQRGRPPASAGEAGARVQTLGRKHPLQG